MIYPWPTSSIEKLDNFRRFGSEHPTAEERREAYRVVIHAERKKPDDPRCGGGEANADH